LEWEELDYQLVTCDAVIPNPHCKGKEEICFARSVARICTWPYYGNQVI
jgi:hypothetical protein